MPAIASINLDNRSVRRILRAARKSFGRYGYQGTSLNRIAKEAQVSKSLLHYHFDSKEHLFLEGQLQLFRDILQRVRQFSGGPGPSAHQLHAALEEVMVALEQDLDQMLVLLELHSVAESVPGMRKHLDEFMADVEGLIVEGLRNILGPAADALAFPPERVARMLRTIFHGLVVEMALASNRTTRTRVRETFDDVRQLFLAVMTPHMV
jgi:AcrR family transcriptional regulator